MMLAIMAMKSNAGGGGGGGPPSAWKPLRVAFQVAEGVFQRPTLGTRLGASQGRCEPRRPPACQQGADAALDGWIIGRGVAAQLGGAAGQLGDLLGRGMMRDCVG